MSGENDVDQVVTSPIKGEFVNIKTIDDHVFSQELLGKGIAIEPSQGCIYAPFDGTVAMLFHTSHAIGLVSDENVEMLIHIGIDTVNLGGKHFYPKVKSNQKFKKGDLLIEFDIKKIKEEGYATITPIIITNIDIFDVTSAENTQHIELDDAIFVVNQKGVN